MGTGTGAVEVASVVLVDVPALRSSLPRRIVRTVKVYKRTMHMAQQYTSMLARGHCLTSHQIPRSVCSDPATERGESLFLNFLIPWSNCQGRTGLLHYSHSSKYVTRSMILYATFHRQCAQIEVVYRSIETAIRMLLSRDPLGRNSIRVKDKGLIRVYHAPTST